MIRNRRGAALLALVGLLAGAGLWIARADFFEARLHRAAPSSAEQPELGLMTTLPIYWPEVDQLGELLEGGREPHWARSALERSYRLRLIDTLSGDGMEVGPLDDLSFLLLAQPRALSPAENVALDGWVRGGGHLLLFADPLLSGSSRFHIGDQRRPQDVALLSPILARWGLELAYSEDQPDGIRDVDFEGIALPVAYSGHFIPRPPAGGGKGACALRAEGLAADCSIGEGQALVLADATLLENGAQESGREFILAMLINRAFDGEGHDEVHD